MLDPTTNPKLEALIKTYQVFGGEAYIGQQAWQHLTTIAGTIMARFIETYVHLPIQALLHEAPDGPEQIPNLTLRTEADRLFITIDHETLIVQRASQPQLESEGDDLPEDVGDDIERDSS